MRYQEPEAVRIQKQKRRRIIVGVMLCLFFTFIFTVTSITNDHGVLGTFGFITCVFLFGVIGYVINQK